MHNAQPSPFTRSDTMFGVCEALGEDFGFNPLYLRLVLPLLLFLSPLATIAGYAAVGAVVLLSRLLFPDPVPAADAEPAAQTADTADEEPLALAA